MNDHEKKYILSTGKNFFHFIGIVDFIDSEAYYRMKTQKASKYLAGAEFTVADDGSSGENYPGISLYHDGMDLVAIVSTGDDVWKLQVVCVLIHVLW